MAEPVQRTVGGRLRYVSCLRFTPRESDGNYRELRERAVLYVNGRLDRVVEDASDVCAGAVYAPFPEFGKLTRKRFAARAGLSPATTAPENNHP
jgi:hypothetical protein